MKSSTPSFLLLFIALTATPVGLPAAEKASVEKPFDHRAPWEREWAYLSRYQNDNARLAAPKEGENRVVFYGDSITEGWPIGTKSFVGQPYLNRGISGQTTAQMLMRFRQDVIELKPAVVVILAGTNDIAENIGPVSDKAIEDNIQSMAELARANGIRVVLGTLLPATQYRWRPAVEPVEHIAAVNRWIREYCAKGGATEADFFPALVGADRGMRPELTYDGVHVTAAGYAIMDQVAARAIQRALP